MTYEQHVFVTGGAGFIGSNFLNFIVPKYPRVRFTCVDKLNYACNYTTDNLHVQHLHNFKFVKMDISLDSQSVIGLLQDDPPDQIINFAAESCVDRSFRDPLYFTTNNILATQHLLEAVRLMSEGDRVVKFLHVSTDEVYGESVHGPVSESSPLNPTNPYSATKAATDLIIQSYVYSYKLPIAIVRSNNIYGSGQYPEKIIPVCINALKQGGKRKIPIHGDGHHKRAYLYVDDFTRAVELLWTRQQRNLCMCGEVFNIAAHEKDEIDNLSLVKWIIRYYLTGQLSMSESVINDHIDTKWDDYIDFVPDRNYNDSSYSLDADKISQLGWQPRVRLFEGLRMLIDHEMSHDNK